MTENLEDHYQTDRPATPEERVVRSLRVLAYAGALISLYGLFLKGIVPLSLMLFGRTARDFAHDSSAAFVPVGVVALSMFRVDERTRLIAITVCIAGLVYYALSLASLAVHTPAKGDFALFSQTYYGLWSSGYFFGSLAVLSGREVRRVVARSTR